MAVKAEGERPGADYDAATYWRIRHAVADELREREAAKYGGGKACQPFTNAYAVPDTTTHSAKEEK